MLPFTVRSAVLAFLAAGLASAKKEQIEISDITIRRVRSAGTESIPQISFSLSGARADAQECSAENIPWPEPARSSPCGDTDYSFLLLPGEDGKEFGLMIYHDVGDRKADLRGWVDVDAECKQSGKGEEICTLKGPISKVIDGPVGGFFGGLFGDL